MMPAASALARGRSVSTSRWRSRCSNRCRSRSSRPAAGSPRGSTVTPRSPCAPIATRSRAGSSAVKCECCCTPTSWRLRRPHRDRPPRTAAGPRPVPPGTGSLPGRAAAQTRRTTGCYRARASPCGGQVHPRPRRVVGRGPRHPRRPRRHPGALIEVLLLHRHLTHDHVVAGLAAALRAGALTADAVALEARKIADLTPTTPVVELDIPDPVPSLTQRRLAQLPPDRRPPPSVAVYDQLLRRTSATEGTTSP